MPAYPALSLAVEEVLQQTPQALYDLGRTNEEVDNDLVQHLPPGPYTMARLLRERVEATVSADSPVSIPSTIDQTLDVNPLLPLVVHYVEPFNQETSSSADCLAAWK